jgi:hypothetical protein
MMTSQYLAQVVNLSTFGVTEVGFGIFGDLNQYFKSDYFIYKWALIDCPLVNE